MSKDDDDHYESDLSLGQLEAMVNAAVKDKRLERFTPTHEALSLSDADALSSQTLA